MAATRKITVEVPKAELSRARAATGQGISAKEIPQQLKDDR